jgi:hypothetical protein
VRTRKTDIRAEKFESGQERQGLMLAAARWPDIFSIVYGPTYTRANARDLYIERFRGLKTRSPRTEVRGWHLQNRVFLQLVRIAARSSEWKVNRANSKDCGVPVPILLRKSNRRHINGSRITRPSAK